MNIESKVGKISKGVNREFTNIKGVLWNDRSQAILGTASRGIIFAVAGLMAGYTIWDMLSASSATSSGIKDNQVIPAPTAPAFNLGSYIAEVNSCLDHGNCEDTVRRGLWQRNLREGYRSGPFLTEPEVTRKLRLTQDTTVFKVAVSETLCSPVFDYAHAGKLKADTEVWVVGSTAISRPKTGYFQKFLVITPKSFPGSPDNNPIVIPDPDDPFTRDNTFCTSATVTN